MGVVCGFLDCTSFGCWDWNSLQDNARPILERWVEGSVQHFKLDCKIRTQSVVLSFSGKLLVVAELLLSIVRRCQDSPWQDRRLLGFGGVLGRRFADWRGRLD